MSTSPKRRVYEPAEWARLVLAGNIRASARLMRLLDDHDQRAFDVLKTIYSKTGNARVIGITGNPGSGKSTLVTQLIGHYRGLGKTVGVVAIDPSSPYSGGAILGDRIRMQKFATDSGVFIRSQATRGKLGGLARSTNDIVNVLDAMGYDVILVETVGVGQDEIDIMKLAQSVLVVMVPGLGDDIQAIKAGLLEIADIFVVNKSDRQGVEMTVRDLRQLQTLREKQTNGWLPPIAKTVATRGEGLAELVLHMAAHFDFLNDSDEISERRRRRASLSLLELLTDKVRSQIERRLLNEGQFDELATAIAERRRDPYTEADQMLGQLLKQTD